MYARRIVGWSIADHLRAELVVDAIEMARWRRRPAPGQTVLHFDRGSQYTSWAFGHWLRDAGLLGSMEGVGSAYGNAMMESFFSTLQRELLIAGTGRPGRSWHRHNPRRRHSLIDYHSPVEHERLYTAAVEAA